MFDCPSAAASSSQLTALYLDYGADEQICANGALEVSERGMRFVSRWRFDIGTQLAISCVFRHPRLGTQRVTVEGTVVWCEASPKDGYESTLLFLELPDELKQSLREFSYQLAG
jgi:hypothetical protein